jgi:hypothetical protein
MFNSLGLGLTRRKRNKLVTILLGSTSADAILGFEPKLVLNFKTNTYKTGGEATTFSSAITHTRASSATMMNSSGTLVTVGNNVPRTGHHIYNGSAWVNEGILHESEARTNLIENSNDLTNAEWRKTSVSNTANAGVSPDGTSNANKVVNDTASGVHYIYVKEDLHTVSGDYTFSFYVASAGYGFVTVGAGTNTVDYYAVVIDLSDGTKTATYEAGTQTDKTCTVEAVGGSYYRVSISGAGERYYIVGGVDTGTYTPADFGFKSFSGDGTSGILAYGAQVEAGLTPSSYIPTSGATATRAADLLTVPAASLPYDNTNMSIQMDGKMTYADNGLTPTTTGGAGEVSFLLWKSGSTDYISTGIDTGGSRSGQYDVTQRSATSGGQQLSQGSTTDYSPNTNVPFNIASRHGSTFINGATEGTLTTSVYPSRQGLADLSSTDLNLGRKFMGTIGQFRMWDEDITDAGIAEAST